VLSEYLELNVRLQALEELVASSVNGHGQLGNGQSAMGPPSIKERAPSIANDTSPLGLTASVNDDVSSIITPNAPVDGMGAILLENEEILTFFGKIAFRSESFMLNTFVRRTIFKYLVHQTYYPNGCSSESHLESMGSVLGCCWNGVLEHSTLTARSPKLAKNPSNECYG